MEEATKNENTKEINPLDTSNVFSKVLFWWLIPLFKKGYNKELTEDDMYQHRESHDSGDLGDQFEKIWNKQLTKRKPSVIKAIAKRFIPEWIMLNCIIIISETIRISQPFMITQLIYVYESNQVNDDKSDVYIYALLIIITSFITNNMAHNFNLLNSQMALKMRVSVCSLIYRKALRLSKSALAETTIGQMVNLLSNDVDRFDNSIFYFQYTYVAPIEMLVVMYLLYHNIGTTALAGAVLLLSIIPLQFWLGKKTSKFRLQTANRTDERVRLMNEIITGIQVIKMYTWEYPFTKLVEFVRMKEMKYIRFTSIIRAILMSCALLLNRCAVGICILVYVLTGNTLTATYAYAITSYYRLLYTVTNYFPSAVSLSAELYVSIKRIQTFLLYDEVSAEIAPPTETFSASKGSKLWLTGASKTSLNTGSKHTLSGEPRLRGPDASISIRNASAKWLKSLNENNLDNINFDVIAGNVVAVIGTVGSGKTTLLHVIMKELELQSGSVNVRGIVSYASQEPWLFGGSIRQNILFGQKFDQRKYDDVVRACALKRDFNLLPHGDRTLAGERGVTLSGGQRARINLARAVYKDADIYLLDDPLSAVDTHVGKQLFDECICGYLSSKCVVLVTHQLQFLKKVKNIYLMNNGRIEVSGPYSLLKNSTNEYSKLLANIEDEEEEVRRRSRMISMSSESEGMDDDFQIMNKEKIGSGTISKRVYINFAKAGGNMLKVVALIFAFLFSQLLDSSAEYFVSIWVNVQQRMSHISNFSQILDTSNFPQTIDTSNFSQILDTSNATNITTTTILPLNLTANILPLNFTTTILPLNNTATTLNLTNDDPYADWWLTPIFTDNTVFYYSILILVIIVLCLIRSLAFYSWSLTASTRLHNKMFANVVYSPMRFFNVNPSGRILNRFSKDIGSIDEALPRTLLDTVQIGLMAIANSFVIGTLTVWILIPTILTAILFYFLRKVYVSTSRNVKRVESVTRSPVFTHLSQSLQGLTTIRAFRAQEILKNEFDNYQNLNSAAYFLYFSCARTFGYWLDFFCLIYFTLVLASLIFIEGEQYGGNMGLALTQAMAITGILQYGMRQWSEFENQMTSVERVQEYADLVQEEDSHSSEPAKTWPREGRVEFNNMSLKYAPEDPAVLKGLNFVIQPREKIGIVGRTGAGKSSLIQALFRLAHIDGSILIDGVDTKKISLRSLRSKISIIPQEPVLFSGTLRKNLDPFDEYSDQVLWNALEEVELKHAVDELPAALDSKMAEGGSNFSVGQRQLVCLARAIVRNNKILVLDEATANVDPHTDGLIQKTIRQKFANCTVLTIAHRLHTIMDCDKVLVMDAGKNVEFDHPHDLLQNTKGIFYSLVMKTGKATAKNLIAVAEQSKKEKSQNV
ncbi:ATP binding cassette (ABC) protein subfamily C member, provisional [Diabrotica virgifera virgifera]|uniref:Probable multidrug resistance-associated protein lethal(2)03659 n=1 Tax=Diabrotica virgifera virgifera TaxID=50390 RepID=A0A6P7FMV9_DIAVI|nr:ATP binding cassette (ABC) protein subfamily C member, provisional [Diabrotica virgifera virgifera]